VTLDWAAYLALGLWLLVPTLIWLCRKWLVARVEKGVQHSFDLKIEAIKAELRRNEEKFKSDLRGRESEIDALRSSVLSGSAGRQSLLDKRRFEAVERIWKNVNDFGQLRFLSGLMARLNFEAIAHEVHDPRMQQVLKFLETAAPDPKSLENVARDEELFVPPLAWAYFSAYKTILLGSYSRLNILKSGVTEPQKFLTDEPSRKILKAALPHQSDFIDKHDAGAFHFLLEEVESLLLVELRKILEGDQIDNAATKRAQAITDAVRGVENEKLRTVPIV